jgi:hypothetical protein
MLMPRSCYQMQHALPERIGAKQKRLPKEAAFVSTTTGETTVNHTLDKIAIASGTAPRIGQQDGLPQGIGALADFAAKSAQSATATAMAGAKEQVEQVQATLQRLGKRLAPVLGPGVGQTGGDCGQGNQKANAAPLVSQIDALTHVLRLVQTELQDLERRLAL